MEEDPRDIDAMRKINHDYRRYSEEEVFTELDFFWRYEHMNIGKRRITNVDIVSPSKWRITNVDNRDVSLISVDLHYIDCKFIQCLAIYT